MTISNLIGVLKKQLGSIEQRDFQELINDRNFLQSATDANNGITALLQALETEFTQIKMKIAGKSVASETQIADFFERVKTTYGFLLTEWRAEGDYRVHETNNLAPEFKSAISHGSMWDYEEEWVYIFLYNYIVFKVNKSCPCPRMITYTVLPRPLKDYTKTSSSEKALLIAYLVDVTPQHARMTPCTAMLFVGEADGAKLLNLAFNKPKKVVALFESLGVPTVADTWTGDARSAQIIVGEYHELNNYVTSPGPDSWRNLREELKNSFKDKFVKPFV